MTQNDESSGSLLKSTDTAVQMGKVKEYSSEPAPRSMAENAVRLIVCFFGLQGSYLTWGIMQEKIMTTTYNATEAVPDGMFPSATFCVFANRSIAIVVAAVICYFKFGTLQSAPPFWYFSPCSLSNVLSSWGQYAALKYVAFYRVPLRTRPMTITGMTLADLNNTCTGKA